MFVFTSVSYPAISAFTADETGSNLPATYAPWQLRGIGGPVTLGPDDPVAQAVARDGFFLLAAGRRTSGKSARPSKDAAIYLFRSAKAPDTFGFSVDSTGRNLPAELGPWQSSGTGTAAQVYAGSSLNDLALSDPIMRAVKKDGFYLARSGLATSQVPAVAQPE